MAKYSSDPVSGPRLKLLLPRIISTFAANKSIREILEELENHQQSADTLGKIWWLRLIQGLAVRLYSLDEFTCSLFYTIIFFHCVKLRPMLYFHFHVQVHFIDSGRMGQGCSARA